MDRWKFVNEKWIPRPVSRGEGVVSGIAAFSYRSLPHWGRGTAPAVDRVLSYIVDLRRISPLIFHTTRTLSGSLRSPPSPRGEGFVSGTALPPIQPPPLRGTSFLWKEGMTTRAPSLGRGCRAQRGGVGFLFCGEAASSLPSPCRESGVILVPSSTTSIALMRASQRGAGSILRLFDRHAFSGGNPLHSLSNVLPHRHRGQDRPARGIPLCGYSL